MQIILWKRYRALLIAGATLSTACGGHIEAEDLEVQTEEVVGGTVAAAGSLPYQVQITRTDSSHWCGGALISNRWVLTAAHCIVGVKEEDLRIVVGERDRTVVEGTEQVRTIAKHYPHPKWNGTGPHDVALIQLSSPVTLNQWVSTIQLPDGNYEGPGPLTISGWGSLSGGGLMSNSLMRADLPLVDHATCAATMMTGGFVFTPSDICAGQLSPVKTACSGDSGGPLVSPTSPKRVVGIVSWGRSSCDKYTVFTRVADYVPWIREVAFNHQAISCQGQTPPTNTGWEQVGPYTIATRIDSSHCNYQQTPEYFTSLGGLNLDGLGGHHAIIQPTATGFGVYVVKGSGITVAQAKQSRLHINWTSAPKNQINGQLCTGSTTQGSTNWIQAPNGRIYVDVNTSACARSSAPKYFASLKGALMTHLQNGVGSIYSPTATGFRVFLEWGTAPSPAPLTPATANQYGFHVGWAAAPNNSLNTSVQCVGNTASGFWNWTQAGPDVIYTTVDTSACGRGFTPRYFTALRGNGIDHYSGALGATTIQSATPGNFRVYIRQPGLTPLVAGNRQYFLNWAAYP